MVFPRRGDIMASLGLSAESNPVLQKDTFDSK